jgi:hypothetical protein
MTAKRLAIVGGVGGMIMYLFDPRLGKTRRAQLADRIAGMTRRGAQRAERKGRYVAGHAHGLQQKMAAAARSDTPPPNDPALVAKIESEVVSRWNYPKGSISINAEDGLVYLRGKVDIPDQIRELESEVRKVGGVMGVVNLLHLPGTPAPNKEEALQASRS